MIRLTRRVRRCGMLGPMSAHILIVEDDERLAKLLAELLQQAGYTTAVEPRGDTAIDRIRADPPALVLLDVNLPGRDGFSVCREVRGTYRGRILVLTARGEEVDEVIGLELGADDYMAKPVSPRRLLARVKALLRRPEVASESLIRNGPLAIDTQARSVELDGVTLELSTSEFDLLLVLAERVGEVVSRDDLYRALRGLEYGGLDRSIDLRISRLRKHLGDNPRRPTWIKTVHGVGYILTRAR